MQIQKHRNQRHLHTCRTRNKIAQYADDLSIVAADSSSVDGVLECLRKYEEAAGAKVNRNESDIMFFRGQSIVKNKWNFRIITREKQILGVYIGKDRDKARVKTWEETIQKVKTKLNLWKMIGLNLRGKVVVSNTLILSKINHVLGN